MKPWLLVNLPKKDFNPSERLSFRPGTEKSSRFWDPPNGPRTTLKNYGKKPWLISIPTTANADFFMPVVRIPWKNSLQKLLTTLKTLKQKSLWHNANSIRNRSKTTKRLPIIRLVLWAPDPTIPSFYSTWELRP